VEGTRASKSFFILSAIPEKNSNKNQWR
jgi:hypothetical protein